VLTMGWELLVVRGKGAGPAGESGERRRHLVAAPLIASLFLPERRVLGTYRQSCIRGATGEAVSKSLSSGLIECATAATIQTSQSRAEGRVGGKERGARRVQVDEQLCFWGDQRLLVASFFLF